MPPLSGFLPNLPNGPLETIIYIVAFIGIILMAYSVFLKAEKKQDAVLLIASLCLLSYAIWIKNIIFIIAMLGLGISSLVEFIEIVLGYHKEQVNKK